MGFGAISIGTLEDWTGIQGPRYVEPSCFGSTLWAEVRDRSETLFSTLLLYDDWDAYAVKKHRKEGKAKITNKFPSPLSNSWVYILDPKKQLLHVLTHVFKPNVSIDIEPKPPELIDDGWWDYGHCHYRHVLAKTVPLFGPEPDWERLERVDACFVQAKYNPVYWRSLDEYIANVLFAVGE